MAKTMPEPGVLYSPTSNRADLRAVLAALQCLDWQYENVRSIVIATDSTYVIYGCTSWLPWWLDNDWNLYSGRPAKNQDLWGEIVKEMKGITNNGVDIKFWHIPIEWNMANGLAKDGAWKQQARYFRPRFGNANR
ncbi:hypothetical protein SCUCBS95973_004065 [Sporothrix curviconia]|uniref:RNase H type-1 domain-containing protein n=1 Tax=Sporothrix curviconia TaxID=1260050 RepID=A0ABP0BKK1_9PEZI